MKICHVCRTEFPSGLKCPGCGAFVVDPPSDDPEPVADTETTGKTATGAPAERGGQLEAPAPGSLGGWILPDAPTARPVTDPPPAPGSLGGWVTAAPTAPTTTGWVYTPPPLPRPGSPEAPAPPAARAPAPVSRPGPTSGSPAGAPAGSPVAPPPAGRTTHGGAPGTQLASAASATSATVAARPDPRVLAGAAAVVVALLIGGFLLLRPKDTGTSAGSLSALAGTCIRYSADKGQLDRSVPCGEPHDGVVLSYVTDQATCPPETDAILATQNDAAGSNGVLCIDETS